MRFSLVDLGIFTACMALSSWGVLNGRGFLLSLGLGPRATGSIALILMVPLGVAAFAVLASPIYRRWQWPPLFLPTCPCCGRRPDWYGILDVSPGRVRVACGRCERPFDLCWRRPAASNLAPDRPSLLLVWPQAIGRWRRVGANGQVIPPTDPAAGP